MTESSPALQFIGVDGGGTKTAFVVVDGKGREVARHIGPTSNPAVIGFDNTAEVLREGLVAVRAASGIVDRFAGGWIGLAGVDRPGDRDRLLAVLENAIIDPRVTNDGELLLSGLGGKPGVGIVAGTGSIAMGRGASGERVRAGGWGHIIGDEGSGWAFGVAALKAIAAEVDGTGEPTPFTAELLSNWGLDDPRQIITRTYAPDTGKREIAGLAHFTISAADAGWGPALQALEQGARDLATQALAVGRRLDVPGPLNLALAGGLLLNHARYRALVLSAIERERPLGTVAEVSDPALCAAQEIAHLHESQVSA